MTAGIAALMSSYALTIAPSSSAVRSSSNSRSGPIVTTSSRRRSASADHFAWHPATGPDVSERDGHVFSGNLLDGKEGLESILQAFLNSG